MSEERRTPLLEEHARLGARLTDFGGWQMPLQYSGVISEHNAVRTSVGIFDVSHLGKLRVKGASAVEALQHALTCDIEALSEGNASYALVLTDSGGCIDDVFVYRIAAQEFLVVPNASNVAAVADAIRDAGAEPTDEWDRWAILALQGPHSLELFDRLFPGGNATSMSLHTWTTMANGNAEMMVARTGYTGERGVELYVPAADAGAVFARLLEAGAVPAGLGARDTLRLEMGYALYGHEITTDILPLEAGLGWVLAWDTPFRGRDALAKVKADGVERKLVGIRCTGKGVPRQGHEVVVADSVVARLTSGNFSPTLQTGIGLALGARGRLPEVGEQVTVQARGRSIEAVIVKPPFIRGERP